MRRTGITLLFALTLATSPDAAETISVRVVADDDPDRGVQSWIKLDETGTMARKARTDRAGMATLSVVACGPTLGIWAEPRLPYLHTGRFDCSQQLVIPVGKARYAAAVEPALGRSAPIVEAASQPPFGGLLERFRGLLLPAEPSAELPASPADPRAALDAALGELRHADAALLAGTLSAEATARGNPDGLAASYAAVAAAAGFRALGLEPGDPARPLIEATGGDARLTAAGRSAVAGFQTSVGLPATGTWSIETLRALPRG